MMLDMISNRGTMLLMPAKRLDFEDQLRREIERCGLTRYRISKMTGIDNAVLSRFMSGKVGMSMDSIGCIFDALDLEIGPRRKRRAPKGR